MTKKYRFQNGRRQLIKQTGTLSALAATSAALPLSLPLLSQPLTSSPKKSIIRHNPTGFNGVRQDPITKLYLLGNGYRTYSPTLMRFNAHDNLSPFGKGGINGYAYCLGDPVNQRDPSGHFALLSLFIGAIVGAVVGAAISAAAEGIQIAINPEHKFDWKQIGIGAALGFISGGFGAASQGAKTSVQIGLAVIDTIVSGGADFGLNIATGTSLKQAGINAGIGAFIGLSTYGIGSRFRGALDIEEYTPSGYGTYLRSSSVTVRPFSPTSKFKTYSKSANRNWTYHDNQSAGLVALNSHAQTVGRNRHPIKIFEARNITRKKSGLAERDIFLYKGTHGVPDGSRSVSDIEKKFYSRAKHYYKKRVKVVDVSKLSNQEYEDHLNLPGYHIVGYCYSRNDHVVRKALGLNGTVSITH